MKDVFRRPSARVREDAARQKPLVARGVRCPAAGLILETGQQSRFFIGDITQNVT